MRRSTVVLALVMVLASSLSASAQPLTKSVAGDLDTFFAAGGVEPFLAIYDVRMTVLRSSGPEGDALLLWQAFPTYGYFLLYPSAPSTGIAWVGLIPVPGVCIEYGEYERYTKGVDTRPFTSVAAFDADHDGRDDAMLYRDDGTFYLLHNNGPIRCR